MEFVSPGQQRSESESVFVFVVFVVWGGGHHCVLGEVPLGRNRDRVPFGRNRVSPWGGPPTSSGP